MYKVTKAQAITSGEFEDATGFSLKPIDKVWHSENKFASSSEVEEIFSGFHANYRPLGNSCQFMYAFKVMKNVYRVYRCGELTFAQQVTLSTSVNNGGVYELKIIQLKDGLFYMTDKTHAYDPDKLKGTELLEGIFAGTIFFNVFTNL